MILKKIRPKVLRSYKQVLSGPLLLHNLARTIDHLVNAYSGVHIIDSILINSSPHLLEYRNQCVLLVYLLRRRSIVLTAYALGRLTVVNSY